MYSAFREANLVIVLKPNNIGLYNTFSLNCKYAKYIIALGGKIMSRDIFISRTNELLKQKGLSQKQLANMSNITEASLSRYLSGILVPRIDVIRNIALALGVSVSYLVGDTNDSGLSVSPYQETYRVVARNKSNLSDEEKTKLIKLLFGEGK